MKPTPHHYLLTRRDYDLLRQNDQHLLQTDLHGLGGLPTLVEERLDVLGPDSPVRLFFASAIDLRRHHVATVERLSELRQILPAVPSVQF
jgi:hypothetical protein